MGKTRPGIERITKQQLQAAHADAIMRLHRHVAACVTCKRASGSLFDRCNTWWQLAKKEHRTARKLRQFDRPETAHMDPLPGLE